MGITTIDQDFKMGIVDEVLTDFLNDRSFETLSELSDSMSESNAYNSLVSSLSESTDNECEKKLSKEQTKKYARMFPRAYRAVQRWANRRVDADNRLKGAWGRWKKRAQRRCDYTEKKLERALEVFSKAVNEAKAAGN